MDRGFRNGIITFDTTNDSFYSGQIVTGRFQFQIEEPLTFQAICVNFLGDAKVSWSEFEDREYNGQSQRYEIAYKGQEQYFNYMQYVAGSNTGFTTLNPGSYTYPFQYQTPYVVPSSYQGAHGNVVYKVVVFYTTLPSGTPHPDEYVTKEFSMVAPLDLNNDQDAKRPIVLEFEEIYSCCLCESKPLTILVRAAVSGYCPGQCIPVEVTADNRSSFEVQKLVLSLRKNEVFRSQQPQSEFKMPEEVVTRTSRAGIPSGSKRTFTMQLRVPDMIAPNLDNCDIIDCNYSIKMELEVSGCNDGSEDEADVILGLIPIVSTLDMEYIHPMVDRLPKGPIPNPALATSTNINEVQSRPIGFMSGVGGFTRNPGYPYPEDQSSQKSALLPPPYPGQTDYSVIAPSAPSAPPC